MEVRPTAHFTMALKATGKSGNWKDFEQTFEFKTSLKPIAVAFQGEKIMALCEKPIPLAESLQGSWFRVDRASITPDGKHLNVGCRYEIHDHDTTLHIYLYFESI